MKKNLFGLTKDSRGTWRRQNLGKVWDGQDWKPVTFYLGRDHAAACHRVVILEKLWDVMSQDWVKDKLTPCPCWDETTLHIPQAVARGEEEIVVVAPDDLRLTAERLEIFDLETCLGIWFRRLQDVFPFVRLRLGDDGAGQTLAAADRMATNFEEKAGRLQEEAAQLKDGAGWLRGQPVTGQALLEALRAFLAHVERKYGTEGYGKSYGNQVRFLIANTQDVPLLMLTGVKLLEWAKHYERRPDGKRGRLAHRSCVNLIKTIREFTHWLDVSETFKWDLPPKFRWPKIRVEHTSEELAARINTETVKRFTVEQLKTLWEYALPSERAVIVLGLNCGFSRAEMTTLMLNEIFSDHEHPKYGVTASWVKRLRRKTTVYGEWMLWAETVQAVEFLKRRRPRTSVGNLFVNKNGKPLTTATKGGNANGQLPNQWHRLLKRVKKDHPDFPIMGLKYLRKTGASLIRKLAGGEVSSMYLSHGPVADTEDKLLAVYANRPFGKLHKALKKLRRKLEPVFAAVPEPFSEGPTRRPSISLAQIKRIRELRLQGVSVAEVAQQTGTSVTTVRRYEQQASS